MVLKHLIEVRQQESVPEFTVRRDILIRHMSLGQSCTLSTSLSFKDNVHEGISS